MGRPKGSTPTAGKGERPAKGHTPVMQQFFRAKEQYPDAILFFRLGDFYELFYADAVKASELLDLTLTSRGSDAEGVPIPMAGVPHHAATQYLTRLLELGQKVAICEQMADPSTVRGIVPREVVRVVSPGLCLEPDALDARKDNYLLAVAKDGESLGIAALELSTGELRACSVQSEAVALSEVARLDPREILVPTELEALEPALAASASHGVRRRADTPDENAARALLRRTAPHDSVAVDSLGRAACKAAAMAVRAAEESQPGSTLVVQRVVAYDPSETLLLDETAVRSLELVETLSGEKRGSLLSVVDTTRTPMGGRLLRRQLLSPLADIGPIRRRHDAVEALVLDPAVREAVREVLSGVGDLERLATRASLGVASPRDLGGIRDALAACEALADRLSHRALQPGEDPLAVLVPEDRVADLRRELEASLVEAPPLVDRQGGIFRDGCSAELDELRALSSSSKDVILELERREKQRTGISSLKVRFTRVFGYYIEITRSNLASVPSDYIRKQTIANGERYVTEELAALEDKILNAEERSKSLEAELFAALRRRVAEAAHRLRELAHRVATIDVHASAADVAHRHGYVRPEVDGTTSLDLRDARHPVVERLAAAGEFVPNDVTLDADGTRFVILTGPNMAGKSTVMRQTALAVVLAQAGFFVPASAARIGLVDRIYSRVGASDNLSRGQSTFMVEMQETASILRGATRRSLVIVDEIGRGTSTYDGVSIAWAVAEYLHDAIGCRTLFATHYHELCELAATRPTAVNLNVAAKEYGNEVVFLRKLLPGGANRSYGVSVARLAGLPPIVLARAKALLEDLESGAALPSGAPAHVRRVDREGKAQLDLFAAPEAVRESDVERTLRGLDPNQMTPLDALVALSRLRAMMEP